MTYKIETGVPKPKFGNPSPERLALDKLQVDESILFPAEVADKARYAAQNKQAKSQNTWKYGTQTQPDGSRRIWRLT